jgi:large subunit ribosomal protein L6
MAAKITKAKTRTKNVKSVKSKKAAMTEAVELPSGVSCSVENRTITLKKDVVTLSRKIVEPEVSASLSGNALTLASSASGKRALKILKTYAAHIRNMILGLDKVFEYKLEMCNVHFPMTVKAEAGKLSINNFLGEKTPRYAVIPENVKVEIKGQQIIVSSHDCELAGQTAANMEKATKVRNRDRRVFQDGIYIVEKAGRKI